MFYRVMALVLPTNALIIPFVSHSIRAAMVKTLGCALVLQAGYFCAKGQALRWRPGSSAPVANLP
ncbi:exopolysaccharide production repressor protein [Mesorhizobium sp. f-mel]